MYRAQGNFNIVMYKVSLAKMPKRDHPENIFVGLPNIRWICLVWRIWSVTYLSLSWKPKIFYLGCVKVEYRNIVLNVIVTWTGARYCCCVLVHLRTRLVNPLQNIGLVNIWICSASVNVCKFAQYLVDSPSSPGKFDSSLAKSRVKGLHTVFGLCLGRIFEYCILYNIVVLCVRYIIMDVFVSYIFNILSFLLATLDTGML